MKKFLVKLYLGSWILSPCLAGDAPTRAEIYGQETLELESLLDDFGSTQAADSHPVLETLATALQQLLESDEACYRAEHAEISAIAFALARLIDSLSFPCQDEDAYDAARPIGVLARTIRDKADAAAAGTVPPPPTDPDKTSLLEAPKALTKTCSVELFYQDDSETWHRKSEWDRAVNSTANRGRFANLRFRAKGSPTGGEFTWTVNELLGAPLTSKDFNEVPLFFEAADGTSYRAYSLAPPVQRRFFVVDVQVVYAVEGLEPCKDSRRMSIWKD